MLDWLFSREKAAYERSRKKGYKEGYAEHERLSLATYDCPNPHCTDYRIEWRRAENIGYGHAVRDLASSLNGIHDTKAKLDRGFGAECMCDVCKAVEAYKFGLREAIEHYFLPIKTSKD